jgi:hypothetical protein
MMQAATQRRRIPVVFLLGFAPLLAGCTAIAEKVATRIAEDSLKREELLTVVEGDVALFRRCLTERGGTCQGDARTALPQAAVAAPAQPVEPLTAALGPEASSAVASLPANDAARMAAEVLQNPVMTSAVDLHNQIRGHGDATAAGAVASGGGGASTVEVNLSVANARKLMDQVHRTTAAGGWDRLADQTAGALARSSPGSAENAALRRDHRRALFLKRYVEAYFRNGRFVAVDFTIDAAEAQQRLAEQLSDGSKLSCRAFNAAQAAGSQAASQGGADDCAALAKTLYDALRGSDASVDFQLVKVSQTGFVSRDGSFSAQFPSFEIDFDPLAPRLVTLTTQAGGSVREIDFTTIGNQLVRVVLEAVFDAHEGLPAVASATGRQLGDDSLPLFDPTQGNVSDDDFSEMTRINDRVSAATGVVLNRVVQGIGLISLNNEPLEELIVTVVTTSVRKAVEKASWCWFSCNLDVEAKRAREELEAAVERGEKTLESAAEREAERVKLSLKIGS